ncbi:MAG: glycerophosphodiester phosphodiesterase [Gaiellaceae bacterium]
MSHRGAAALAPENTLAGIEAALDHGVDMIEFDVLRDDRGRLVLAHDLGDASPASPTLEATLAFLREASGPTTTVDLDLKVGDAAAEVVQLLHRFELIERTVVCALHSAWILDVRREDGEVTTGLSYPRDRAGVAERPSLLPVVRLATNLLRQVLPLRVLGMATHARADAVMLHHSVVSAAAVRRCASGGLPVFAWTVDDIDTARAMVAAGVRGIVSNDPRVLDAI